MLGRSELAHWAARFGVADDQIRRDHVITHILVSLAATEANDVVFYGGTALARTHLPDFRLSEDVDLLVSPRAEWAERIERELPRALRRHVGRSGWDPAPTLVPERAAARLVAGGLSVRVQLVSYDAEQRRWPVERHPIETRYADAAPIELTVPTRATFAAMKTLAWADRHTPRDLADLAALAGIGALDAAAARLMAEMAGWRPIPALFDTIPEQTRAAWHVDLAHQMVVPPNPDEALAAVRAAWAAAIPA
jgi:predicted nucleotidyltransferase component of viral defense system